MQISPSNLPVVQYIDKNDVVLITAETGSGKTTRNFMFTNIEIPQFLVQAGYTLQRKKIGVALPRRIAAISISKRISAEMGLHQGEIAHHVRFNSTVNQNTRVCLMTDGMLVQKLYQDPLLLQYSVIVLDDIHERSINYDLLFGMIKKILLKRKDLKLIITSATLEQNRFTAYFQKDKDLSARQNRELKVTSLNIAGRLHSVKIHYLKEPSKNYFLKTFQTIVYLDKESRSGNILVFLTSVQQIEAMINLLDSYAHQDKRKLKVLPLHSTLTVQEQAKVFEEQVYERKIILSTNIAESSVTIPDITFVIDCGYVKCKVYQVESGIQKMMVVPCGKYSCSQRAGRAGRVSHGQCFRIFPEKAFINMPQKLPPQIMRVDLCSFILKLKGLGVQNIANFEFLESPSEFNTTKAIDTLFAFELINQDFQLTEKGRKVAELPLSFKNACMLMNSFDPKFGCSKQTLMLVSMLEIQRQLFTSHGISVIKTKKRVGAKQGDFLTLINIFLRYFNAKNYEKKRVCSEMKVRNNSLQQAVKIHQQLISQIKDFNRFKSENEKMQFQFGENQQAKKKMYTIKSSADVHQTIQRCIFSGYFTNIAQLQGDATYANIRSKEKILLHPTSILSVTMPEWIVYYQIVKSNGYYIYNGSQIEVDWIHELAGHYYKDKRKEQQMENFDKEKDIQRPDYTLALAEQKKKQQPKTLVQIGGEKKKTQLFKTSVLGLKKTIKKSKLSFQDDI